MGEAAQKQIEHEELTQELVKHLFHYDPNSGVLYWKNPRTNRVKKGALAGHDRGGYMQVMIGKKTYYQHRIIWLYVHGRLPDEYIDHINGDGSDNRLENLREVSKTLNCRNMKLSSHNKSGVTGVYYSKENKKWCAQICLNNKTVSLGLFKDKDDAILARKKAEQENSFHANHGRNPEQLNWCGSCFIEYGSPDCRCGGGE